MNKKTIAITIALLPVLLATGCTDYSQSSQNQREILYTYVDESSEKEQFQSSIGTVVEQPILDENSQKIKKRLYVDSSRELLTKESIVEFYNSIKDMDVNYEEIVISIGNNEAIHVSLINSEVWYCTINDDMELTKIKKLYN